MRYHVLVYPASRDVDLRARDAAGDWHRVRVYRWRPEHRRWVVTVRRPVPG